MIADGSLRTTIPKPLAGEFTPYASMYIDLLPDEALTRACVANGHIMSVRAAAYHIAGHELHHLNSIKQNYLS